MHSYKSINNIRSIVERYDAYIISLPGIVYDESALIPGVLQCIEKLAENGKTVLFIVNSSRRAPSLSQSLSQMGLPPRLYHSLLSSGEETFLHLAQRTDPWHATLGKYCFYLGPFEENEIIEDLGLYPVSDVSRADFILNLGYHPWHKDREYYDAMLKRAVSLQLPMVCANPDEYVLDKGVKRLMAGSLARQYQDYGGHVRYHGKPFSPFYRQVLAKLKKFDLSRIIAIGNSLETDILGATLIGLNSILVTSSLQSNQFSLNYPYEKSYAKLDNLFKEFKLEPNYVLKRLKW